MDDEYLRNANDDIPFNEPQGAPAWPPEWHNLVNSARSMKTMGVLGIVRRLRDFDADVPGVGLGHLNTDRHRHSADVQLAESRLLVHRLRLDLREALRLDAFGHTVQQLLQSPKFRYKYCRMLGRLSHGLP